MLNNVRLQIEKRHFWSEWHPAFCISARTTLSKLYNDTSLIRIDNAITIVYLIEGNNSYFLYLKSSFICILIKTLLQSGPIQSTVLPL